MKNFSNAFELIKNLSMSEKRYFKIFSERHVVGNQNKYTHIFNVLDKQKEEDDEKLSVKLDKLNVKSDFLAADKNYLYHLILRSLLSFHHNKSNTILLTEQLFIIEILYEKGLYVLCCKEIEKAKITAEKIENFTILIELLTWERKAKGYSKGFEAAYEINQKIDHYLNLLNNQQEFTNLYFESLKFRNKGFKARELSRINEFKILLINKLLRSEDYAQSMLAKIRYHLIFTNFYYVNNDLVNEQKHLEKLISLMDNSAYYVSENPFDYIYVNNYLLDIKKHQQEDEFYELLKKFRAFPQRLSISKEKANIQVFIFSYLSEFSMLITKNKYRDALELIPIMEEGLIKHKSVIEPAYQINFYYLFACVKIATGNFKKALKYINTIINDYKEEQREDYFIHAHLLNLIIHFELEHYELMDYIHGSTLNFYKKRNKLYKTELAVLNFLKQIKDLQQNRDLKKNYLDLKKELESIKESNFEKVGLDLFNFNLWADSKIKNCTIADLF